MNPVIEVQNANIKAVTITGETLADVLHATADYVEDCDAPIFDIVITMTDDGMPIAALYQGR